MGSNGKYYIFRITTMVLQKLTRKPHTTQMIIAAEKEKRVDTAK